MWAIKTGRNLCCCQSANAAVVVSAKSNDIVRFFICVYFLTEGLGVAIIHHMLYIMVSQRLSKPVAPIRIYYSTKKIFCKTFCGDCIFVKNILTKAYYLHILYLTIWLNVLKEVFVGLQITLSAIADPTRRKILKILKKSALSAGEIANKFEISAPAISKHLKILKNADLIRSSQSGKFIIYELNTSVLEEILLWVKNIKGDKNGRD